MTSLSKTLKLAQRGASGFLLARPLSISFEITRACNARCKHCHLGGPIPNEKRASADRYAEIGRTAKPVVAQISGGEPLLRRDLEEIAQALSTKGRVPFIVVTTNAALLTIDRFQKLREAGVDEFSVSLDYPDRRHDDFRGVPGLFEKIRKLTEAVNNHGDSAVILSCVVQSDNFRALPAIARLAVEWGVRVNFSTYTRLRTQDDTYMIAPKDLPELRAISEQLLEIRKKHKNVYASRYIFDRMIRFYENGGIPGCRAGERFWIVNPDGTLSPCGLIMGSYRTPKQLQDDFLPRNHCTECNTSIRANCEKPVWHQIKDNLHTRLF
ncbi:radical SAM protein [bacterium]|nr:radical SAM protein [bacterium]